VIWIFDRLDLVDQVAVEKEVLVEFDVIVSFEVLDKLLHKLDLVEFQ
jgi:hypothetical protein